MRHTRFGSRPLAIAAVVLCLTACRGSGGFASSPGLPFAGLQPAQAPLEPTHHSKIQHIVIIVQENRSFNNLFYGFPGAKTVKYGYDSHGQKVEIKPVGLVTKWDLAHSSIGYYAACNGTGKVPGTDCRMNGFNKAPCGGGICPKDDPEYSYVPHDETRPYFAIAHQYVLADQMYASNFDASSYVSHQYIIAGRAGSAINYPESWWGCEGGKPDRIWTVTNKRDYGPMVPVCFNYKTLGDELDDAGLSWRFYAAAVSKKYGDTAGIWSSYQAIKHIYYGSDWKHDVVAPPSRFLVNIANGELANVTWITPTCANSDHPLCNTGTGPSWVTSVVDAIGESKYWGSTAIFLFWDDYGGWYDPEPPAYVDYDGLGLRVPLVIISPYARKGYVSHVHYEHGTILKFVENTFGLPRLAASDKRANPPDDAFDFSQRARKFVPFHAPYDERYFLRQPLDTRPPDTN